MATNGSDTAIQTTDSGKRTRRSDEIAETLRREIAMGTFPEKSFLPSERELATRFAAGRMTVSEALEQLADDGIVVRAHGRGTQVISSTAANTPTLIRVIHPMHPNASLMWRKAFELLRGIEQAFESSEFQLDRFCSGNPLESQASVELPSSPCPTVFLEALPALHPYMKELDEAGVPFTIANLECKHLPYSATIVNHQSAMHRAVELLAEMGHRRIAYIGVDPVHLFYGDAERGFLDGMTQANLPIDRDLVIEVQVKHVPTVLTGYCETQRLLQRSDRPTAIVCARDTFAEGAWHAIEDAGLQVGHDVSLVGFDDISASIQPSQLTTFREPCYEMGHQAALLLIDQLVRSSRSRPEQITFEPKLVMRRSAGPAPRDLS